MITTRWRYWLTSAIILVAITAVVFHVPIPQDPRYHDFADQRTMFGIPNALNVLSNIPFLFVGAWGLFVTVRSRTGMFLRRREKWAYIVLFLGVALTCFGSGYYHWSPNNETLVWDRIPMAIGFAGLLSATLSERTKESWGFHALAPLLVAGVASVVYWRATEHNGRGDLRAYVLVQFGSLLLVLLLITLFPARYTRSQLLFGAVGLYAFAKVLEAEDRAVYRLFGRTVSGHSLKHLAAAFALLPVAWMLQRREPRREAFLNASAD